MHTRIAIIGTGFAGIGAAIRLREAGIDDFVMIERSGGVGGTWRDNHYPACACDVPARLYSFSFAQDAGWMHSFAGHAEILGYLERLVYARRLRPFIRFNETVEAARWDPATMRWTITTSQNTRTASVLVLATGPLSEPSVPDLPGLSSFEGTTFHSADWNHGYDLRGKRVAVIGTGASAIQFVPQIQPLVRALSLFQRTPPWVIPRRNRSYSERERAMFRAVPPLQRIVRGAMYVVRELSFLPFRHPALARVAERLASRHLARQVADFALRAKLTPTYSIGCKRILISDDYFPAITQPNVELVTDGIAEIVSDAVVSGDGTVRPIDAIIFATGFYATDPPLAPFVFGRGGRSLRDAWTPSMRAFASTTVSGFPNLFVIPGPNSGLGHTSLIYMIESQIAHMMSVLRHMERESIAAIEPSADAQRQYVSWVDERMRGTVWTTGKCASWYLDATGRNSTLWPDFTFRFRRRVATMRAKDYVTVPDSGS